MTSTTRTGFLLNHSCRDNRERFEITLYAVTNDHERVKIVIDNFRPLFFIPSATPEELTSTVAERKPLGLRMLISGSSVDCLYFQTQAAFGACGRELRLKGVPVYESDVNPVDRFLMERFVCGAFEAAGSWTKEHGRLVSRNPKIRGGSSAATIQPDLIVLSLDIETNARTNEILSIACHGKSDVVFMRTYPNKPPPTTDGDPVLFCHDERNLLVRFFDYIASEDPDILIGWSIVDFDLRMIQERCLALGVPFAIGRDPGARVIDGRIGKIARVPGRVIMDVPSHLRANFRTFEEYSLDFVASAMLGKGKSINETGDAKIDEIIRRWSDDPLSLARYNLLDAKLTREIFDHAAILPNAIERSRRSGHLLDRTGGSVAAFDFLYLPRLHRAGYVAPDATDVPAPSEPLPGGHVLEPRPGFYENVLVFDFRSLYPSIIMTFKIDPLGMVAPSQKRIQGPVGPSFANDVGILPSIIAELLQARALAKRENNPYLSQAIKILMNSFYGVLGAQGCRFFSSELATTITQTGQYILKQTIENIQKSSNCPVIYGDTDSLFVLLGAGKESAAQEAGNKIARDVTAWLASMLKDRFGVMSGLELQFERHFRHFFMPALRGSASGQGSKKHYCGIVEGETGPELLFKGMESARSDWTDLAKQFQHDLFMRAFAGEPVEDLVTAVVDRIRNGEADDELIYKKRLRKGLDEYTDNVPPHVQAAKLMKSPGHLIRYYITTTGPQPVENRTAPIDYDHYVDCQIKPIADGVLEWLGTSFDKITSGQQELF